MPNPEPVSFWDFIFQSELRFYQERDLGLDLYHTGLPGALLVTIVISSAIIFLLAIFHVIPVKKHVVSLLLSLGLLAALTGWGFTYWHVENITQLETQLVRESAGPLPANQGQLAAVLALPLLVGALTLVADVGDCVYMAIFWVTDRNTSTPGGVER